MANEYIISDFSSAVIEKENLSSKSLSDRWETVPYETAEISGTLLIASDTSEPLPVTVAPSLLGWYRIYVCMTDIFGGNHIELHLTDDEFPTTAAPGKISRYTMWTSSEKAEEVLWKCADMTGQRITISKTKCGFPHTANILWLRFVPMSEKETADYLALRDNTARKTMFAHMDGDFHANDGENYCKSLYAMKDSDVGTVCMEVVNDLVEYSSFDAPYAPRKADTWKRMEYCRRFSERRKEIYPGMIAYAHKNKMKLFAGHRMQLSSFAFPLEQPLFTVPFVDEHPEYRCLSRDGKMVDFLSYGYHEVQNFMIENILESARYGFDGVHLIFDRGQHLLFEEPVKARYAAKYGEEDFYRLPLDDARLIDIKSEILTEFLMKLRLTLNEYAEKQGSTPLKIYMTAYFTYEDGLLDGFDIERFAAAGVIDGIVQAKMHVWEDTDGAMAEDGLIDLEKYAEKAKTEYVIRRDHSSNMARIVEGLPKYRAVADRYGIELFSENQWECAQPAEAYVKSAKAIYAAGGKGLALWDCYPCRVNNLGEWAATARLGHSESVFSMTDEAESYHKMIKILSWNGKDMRYYNPSWRG
ncbi:MAG: hypothetical protein IJA86_03080 [Clostridia bacterium]|nr:hypothetical protein [Clostridia bacterium]